MGQPVIRGMSGNRVKILNNGMNVRDAAGLAADHILEVDLNNVQQIEIIRGPSSLLYTNGSIGGIVNVVDNTIARSDFDQMEFKFGAEGQSVNDGEAYDFSYQNNIGGLNISLAHKTHNFGNFDTPAGAILHSEEEHEGEEEHEDEEGHGHEEDLGFVANSDFESKATRFGVSKAGDWGYFGVSVNKSDSVYGIPFHQEPAGAHGGHGVGGLPGVTRAAIHGSRQAAAPAVRGAKRAHHTGAAPLHDHARGRHAGGQCHADVSGPSQAVGSDSVRVDISAELAVGVVAPAEHTVVHR